MLRHTHSPFLSTGFPAAILQKPLYSKVYPASLNYGAIGSVSNDLEISKAPLLLTWSVCQHSISQAS